MKMVNISLYASILPVFAPLIADNPQLDADINLYYHRCSQCHSIEMTFNDDTVLPSEVKPLIERMMNMPGALIQPQEKTRLYQAKLYLINLNQKAALNKKLMNLPEDQKKKEIEDLKEALKQYKD